MRRSTPTAFRSGEPPIRLTRVCKSYAKGRTRILVLNDLTLSIPAGEFVGVLGTSGSGKTTLLNLLGGLDVADTGEVIVANENLSRLREAPLCGPAPLMVIAATMLGFASMKPLYRRTRATRRQWR